MDIKVMDCTLSDGGIVNNWEFGKIHKREIVEGLVESNVDIIDLGYLKNVRFNKDKTVYDSFERICEECIEKNSDTLFSVSVDMKDIYSIEKIPPAETGDIDIIRVIIENSVYKDEDVVCKMMEYLEQISNKGYKACVKLGLSSKYDLETYKKVICKLSEANLFMLEVYDEFHCLGESDILDILKTIDTELKENVYIGYNGCNNGNRFDTLKTLCESKINRVLFICSTLGGIGEFGGSLNTEDVLKVLSTNYGMQYKLDSVKNVRKYSLQSIAKEEIEKMRELYSKCAFYRCDPRYIEFLAQYSIELEEVDEILKVITERKIFDYNENLIRDLLYKERKAKKSLAVIVPTANRLEIINYWINKNAKSFYAYGVDLIFFDSSTGNEKNAIEMAIKNCGYNNVIYSYYDGVVDDVICDKVYDASKKYCQKYDYIWITRDRSVINIENVISNLRYAYMKDMDFMVVYPHQLPVGWSDQREYDDCAELFRKLCGEMTSLGSIIFSGRVLKELVDHYPVDPERNRGLWLVMPLFQYIGEHKFKAFYFAGQSFTPLPYTTSYWIKKQTLLPLFSKKWNRMLDLLPKSYEPVLEDVRNFTDWTVPPFAVGMVLNGRASGDFSFSRVWEYKDELKRCAKNNLKKIWLISCVPSFVARYIANNGQSKGVSIIRWIYGKCCRLARVVASLLPRKKYAKPFSGKDYGAIIDSFKEDESVESKLLVGNPDLYEGSEVAIVIPTNNRADLIEDTLKSIEMLNPVNYKWYVVIVDNAPYDGNKNKTQVLIEQLNNPRFVYYRNAENIGVTGNMNRGVKLARSKWIAMLHDDDLLCQDYLERVDQITKYLHKNTKDEVGLLFSECAMYHSGCFKGDKQAWSDYLFQNYIYTTMEDRYDVVRVKESQFVYTSDSGLNAPTYGCLYLKKAYLEVGGMRKESDIGILADLTMDYKIMENYAVYRCKGPFGLYRWNNNESSFRVRDIINGYYDLREYIYRKHPVGRWIKNLLRYDHLALNKQAFSSYDNKAAENALKENVKFSHNPIRYAFVKGLRKGYYNWQKKHAIRCCE